MHSAAANVSFRRKSRASAPLLTLMQLHRLIEEQIQEAIANGEFDNLPGKGKPLNLDDYFRTREDLRMGFSLLKSNGFVPEEVALLNEIRALEEQREQCTAPDEIEKLRRAIQERNVRLNLMLENLKQRHRHL
jgi:Domain of unknown function (DUF1992)